MNTVIADGSGLGGRYLDEHGRDYPLFSPLFGHTEVITWVKEPLARSVPCFRLTDENARGR